MKSTYYPLMCYSGLSEVALRKALNLSDKYPSRSVNRYDKKSNKVIQAKMTLFLVSEEDYNRVVDEGFFNKENGKNKIECGEYHNDRKNRLPVEGYTSNLFLRFDPDQYFTHAKITEVLEKWLNELQTMGVIGIYRLVIPLKDRTGEGVHKGIAFLYFNEDEEMKDKCITFAMLHNRRIPNSPTSFINVSWMKERSVPK